MLKLTAGSPASTEIFFAPDPPLGAISYVLRDGAGTTLLSSTTTPTVGAVSWPIVIAASYNTVASGAGFEYRQLDWSYTTTRGAVTGVMRYRVDPFLSFGVAPEGVRVKLGATKDELPDEDIDLTAAYLMFKASVTDVTAAAADTGLLNLRVTNAIEAQAALYLLPTLQLKMARMETSGTNTFQRFAAVDWEMLGAQLQAQIADGRDAIDVPSDALGGDGFIFALSTRVDPLTGV